MDMLTAIKMKKKLDDNIFELRSEAGNNIQRALYLHWNVSRYIITHGFSQKIQNKPRKEILHTLAIYKEFEEENNANS